MADDSPADPHGYGPFQHVPRSPSDAAESGTPAPDQSPGPGRDATGLQGGPIEGDNQTSGDPAEGGARPITGAPVDSGPPDAAGAPGDSGSPDAAGAPGDSGPPGTDPMYGNASWGAADPYGLGPTPASRGPRIEPSPPPDRSLLYRGLAAGLIAGLLLFGAGGWFLGRSTATTTDGRSTATTTDGRSTTTNPTLPPTLGVYEQSQQTLNQPKFPAGLMAISQGWLPYLSGCARSGTTDGPPLNPGEEVRVRCTLGGMSAIFVEYATVADRDTARVEVLGQNVDARSLTPGAGTAVERATPSGRTRGNYVEYAYHVTEQKRTRVVGGLWWDDTATPTAAYLLAYWDDGLGRSWAPLRDLWTRNA